MELQLSLALPIHSSTPGFDLNMNVDSEPDDLLSRFGNNCPKEISGHYGSKSGFAPMECDRGGVLEMFPLVSWNGDDPNDEEDGSDEEGRKGNSDSSNGEYGETNFIDGWPPINSWRRNLFLEHQGGPIANDRRVEREGDDGRMNSIFVKVKMEGVGIGRKVDLNLYHSYEMLTMALINMFAKYQEDDNGDAGYTLLYQDKEGNWLLAGQVPWQTFIDSIQRMMIIRNDGARSGGCK